MLERVLQLLDAEDSTTAIELITSLPPTEAMNTFEQAIMELYWKRKDLPVAITFGRAGVQYGMNEAREIEKTNRALANEILAAVKTISYNVASFTWRGWNEPGIKIADSDEQLGFEYAVLNLRLAEMLDKPHLAMSRARWLVGAFHLAFGDLTEAKHEFASAASLARVAMAREDEMLNEAYVRLTALLTDSSNLKCIADFDAAREALLDVKEGQEYVHQIDTAKAVFSK
jgi:hypothetical protein